MKKLTVFAMLLFAATVVMAYDRCVVLEDSYGEA
jgi:hypothetical protein